MIYYTEMLDIDIKQLQHDCIELSKKIENDIIGPQELRKYSRQPRGCSMAYLIHYMERFQPEEAQNSGDCLRNI